MARNKNRPHLHPLMHKGFKGGLHWDTRGEDEPQKPDSGLIIRQCRFLLHHPHSFHIANIITKGLGIKNRLPISMAFRYIYQFAADNIHHCYRMEPQEFFARAKNGFGWSEKISDAAFWAFTYKAFHARALFLHNVLRPEEDIPKAMPLAEALDEFRETFDKCYPVEHAQLAEGSQAYQEDIEGVEDHVSLNKALNSKYFPDDLTHPNAEGDGTDKPVTRIRVLHEITANKPAEVTEEEYIDYTKIPDEDLFILDNVRASFVDMFKKLEIDEQDPKGVKEGRTPAAEAGTKRAYDSFKTWRENGDGLRGGEPDGDNNSAAAGEDQVEVEDDEEVVGGSNGDDGIPEMKKLKVCD